MESFTFSNQMLPEEYNELRKSVDWSELTPAQAERGLAHTTFLVAVRDGEQIIGMGRILFDYGYTAYLGDVIVCPQYQGRGIGKQIVQMLMEQTMEAADEGDRIMFILGAAKGKEPFYEKLGFQIRPNDVSGHGMFQWRKKKSNTEG